MIWLHYIVYMIDTVICLELQIKLFNKSKINKH